MGHEGIGMWFMKVASVLPRKDPEIATITFDV